MLKPGATTLVYDIDLGTRDSTLEFLSDPGDHTMRISAVSTCCANASKANERIVRIAPREAKYL